MPNRSETILLCTVGGSHQPIMTTIKEIKPDYVCFICSEDDPATGKPGSYIQITGKGAVISKKPNEKPTLPNIPTQLNLQSNEFEVKLVPADDLDKIVIEVNKTIKELKARFPNAHIIADYTGGTKSMTAGLIISCLEDIDIELRLVTGARANLIKVNDDTQRSISASIDLIRYQRKISPYLYAWKRYAYDEAFKGLSQIEVPRDQQLRAEFNIAQNLSQCFDLWDKFDHEQANTFLKLYASKLKNEYNFLLPQVSSLIGRENDSNEKKQTIEACKILDLWLNAQRRAIQGRYDDAVARIYRLLEWIAQWLIYKYFNKETSKMPSEILPSELKSELKLELTGEKEIKLGLLNSWKFISLKLPKEDWVDFFKSQEKILLNFLSMRNDSILGHGFTPVKEDNWQQFSLWVEGELIPLFLKEANIKMPKQLPNELCWKQIE